MKLQSPAGRAPEAEPPPPISDCPKHLKLLKPGSRAATIKIEEQIYDVVDEKELEAIVAKRRDDCKSFIVDNDDDSLGYGDQGQEEDWTVAAWSSDGESDADRSKKKEKIKSNEKVKSNERKPTVASSSLGMQQRISSMLTSSSSFTSFKKHKPNPMSSNSNDSSSSVEKQVDDMIVECTTPGDGDEEWLLRHKRATTSDHYLKRGGRDIIMNNVGSNSLNIPDDDIVISKNEEIMNSGEAAIEEELENYYDKVEEVRKVVKEEEKQGDPSPRMQLQKVSSEKAEECNKEKKLELEENNGSLPFYILDAHDDGIYGANVGNVYLFGKVKSGGSYHSCCVVVKNMKRCLYAIPTVSFIHNEIVTELEKRVEELQVSLTTSKQTLAKLRKDGDKFRMSSSDLEDIIAKLEKDLQESQTALSQQLHELASDVKSEMAKALLEENVSSFTMALVKRNYAFDRSDIAHGENYVLKITYPFKDSALPSDLNGNHFCALLGTHNSALELFLIKRKIKGPSWLSISKFSSCPDHQRVSWCKFEIIVDFPKDIQVSTSSKIISEIPPVVVTALNLKTIIDEKQNVNEIVSASLICCHKVKIDTPMVDSEWTRPGMLSHFTVVRNLEGIFPMGFKQEAANRNATSGSEVVCYEHNERALLNRLMVELHKLDSDVLVGHNISGFDLDVLLHRFQACKPIKMWSTIGRLRRLALPKLNKGSSLYGSSASSGIMSCIAGRLLCDIYICSRDLLKEVSFSLTQLAKTQLNKDRKEISPQDISQMFQSSESLMELIEYGETDAWLSLELMFHLSVLPLTRQLTNISGNLWHKTLQGARAQRVEYLLLYAFHAKKFIVPDKFSNQPKETKATKRKGNSGTVSIEIDPDDTNFKDAPQENGHGKIKKGSSYSGGLVLEPKKGLYDKYILLLDFNSLYPSIIQEYNICFTTVDRSADGSSSRLPSSKKTGVLPELLKNLVDRRRMVKSWLKSASGLKVQQLDIQQQALKLTANSMYGCLGFSNSRFYAKPLADLITQHGREILQSTVNLVQDTLNLEVIYGDTDSIMIYSGHDDIGKAKSIAGKVIHEVNKKYKCLEIDLDGLYKRMLLLKKKKYAAVKMHFKDGKAYEVIERKGLDMVRRDWSLLSKELGDFCLGQILSGGSCEDVVEEIHNSLMKAQEQMRSWQIPLEKYVITKTLTKAPEAYPDARSQPHVEVALRMKRSGYVTGCSAGDTVPYVICCEQGNGLTTSVGIAQRARHPDELKQNHGNWKIDIDYYLAQQIHPVISRLCATVQGTSPARLADCLGLDSSKFQNKSSDSVSNDPSSVLLFTLDDDERFRGCKPLVLSCSCCSNTFECSTILSSVCALINPKTTDIPAGSTYSFWQKLRCPKCPEEGDVGKISPATIANQVKRQAEGFMSMYYKGLMMCDDETCNCATRSVNLRVLRDSEKGTTCPNYPLCNGHLIRKYSEADLYRQLTYFCHTLDTVRCTDKIKGDRRLVVEKELSRLRPLVESAASTVQKLRDRCAYGWVQLKDFYCHGLSF